MTYSSFPGCCQANIIYGLGQTQYDGRNAAGRQTVEEFEAELLDQEQRTNHKSLRFITINDDQYAHFGESLTKNGWSLVNVTNSLGHPTVIFTYIKPSSLTSKETVVERLQARGINLDDVPVQRKRKLKKVVDKAAV